jgi:hypothetical protein
MKMSGALFPRQADVDAKTILRARALVSSLHDARPGTRDDHESRLNNLSPEIHRLLILLGFRLGAGGAEDGDLAFAGVGGEKAEGIAQFAEGGLDHPHISSVLDVLEQFQAVFDDVCNLVFVIAATLILDEFLNPPRQFRICWSLFVPLHVGSGETITVNF